LSGTPKHLPLPVSRAGKEDGPFPGKKGSLASVDEGGEGTDLTLQERLELFFRSMFVVSFGFAVLALATSVSTGIASFQAYLTHPSNELHRYPSADAFARELRLAQEGVRWTPEEAQAWWASHAPLDSGGAVPSDHLQSGHAQGEAGTGVLSVIGIDWRDR